MPQGDQKMKRTVLAAALTALAATGALALDPGQTEFEHNGWYRYTNQSTNFAVTDPSVGRFSLERGYVRLSHQWTSLLFTKFTLDFHSSDKYSEGSTVRLKEGYLDFALPLKDFTLTAGLQRHYFGLIYSWDYTHPDKSLADDRGVCASADYGITLNGFLPSGLGEVQLGVYNGEGYKYAGKYVNLSPELLASLRLTPFGGLQVGASVFTNAEDFSLYKNDVAGGNRSSDNTLRLMPDTTNTGRFGLAPMARVAFGPVSLTGEYLVYNYTRTFSQYGINFDTTGTVTDSTLAEKSKDYAASGIDLVPQVNLLGRRLEVYGRFSTWEQKEQSGDSMPVNLSKSFLRYGAGFNWHFQRRASGKPGAMVQLAWMRTQTRVEDADPTDTFMAQVRFEWNAILNPPGM
jgi:hypothetical protein